MTDENKLDKLEMPREGFAPPYLAVRDFKSLAYASFANGAKPTTSP